MSTPFQDLLALGAAACWAMSSLMAAAPAKHLGAIAFVRWRMTVMAGVLWVIVLFFSTLPVLHWGTWGGMIVSGWVGIFVGDTALFAAMNRLGPRRTGVLFATHALFSALLGFLLLGERLGVQAYLGASLTVAGVMIAIALGQRKDDTHEWEATPASWSGVLLVLLAAFCQALGALIAKSVMAQESHMDPMLSSAIRVSASVAALWLWRGFNQLNGGTTTLVKQPLNRQVFWQTTNSGLVGMVLGMGMLLWALQSGSIGSVGALSGLSPVLVLPLLWWKFRRPPSPAAWIGACVAVLGCALVITR